MAKFEDLKPFEKIKKSQGKNLEDKYGKFGCRKLNKRDKKNAFRNYEHHED